MNELQVAVVGCGIAGATFAYKIRESDLSVGVFEKSGAVGERVRCGCGFSANCFSPLGVPLRDGLVLNEIRGISYVTPLSRGWTNKIPGDVFILDKGRLIEFLARRARATGVKVFTGTKITGIRKNSSGGYDLSSGGERFGCKVLIDCGGVDSPVRSFLGLTRPETVAGVRYDLPRRRDVISALGLADREDLMNFVLNAKLFPKGYAWIFPSGDGLQVGAVCEGNPVSALDVFLERRGISISEVVARIGGKVPSGGVEERLTYGRTLLLGDSGSLVDPLNFAGNYGSMLSACIAAEEIERYFNSGDPPGSDNRYGSNPGETDKKGFEGADILRRYQRRMLSHPSQSPKLKAGAKALYSLDNIMLDLLGKSARKKGKEGISVARLILAMFPRPSLWKNIGKLVRVRRAVRPLLDHGF